MIMKKNILTPEEVQDLLAWESSTQNPMMKESKRETGGPPSRKKKSSVSQTTGGADFFRNVLNALGEAIITTDRNGRILFQNNISRTILDQSLDKILKKPFSQAVCLLDSAGLKNIESPVHRCIEEGVQILLLPNTILRRPDGSTIAIAGKITPIFDKNGLIEGVVVSFHIARSEGRKPLKRKSLMHRGGAA
jgi:PAS domain-containing protein